MKYISTLKSDVDPTWESTSEKYSEELATMYYAALTKFSALEISVDDVPSNSTTMSSAAQGANSKIKCKSLEPSKFSGNVREYPMWKQRFTTKFKKYYGDQAGLVLKDIVIGDAASIIRSVDDDDVVEMLRRLDKKYGDPQLLVDTVIEDIENIHPISSSSDASALRRLHDTLTLALNDLEYVNLTHEIKHSSTVRMLEQRLPSDLQKEWAKRKIELSVRSASDLFDPLLECIENSAKCAEDVLKMSGQSSALSYKFSTTNKTPSPLEQQHGQFENLGTLTDDDGSQPPGRYCAYHQSTGHWTRHCFSLQNKRVDDLAEWLHSCKLCLICFSPLHGNGSCPLSDQFLECRKPQCTAKHLTAFHDAIRKLESSGRGTAGCRAFQSVATLDYRFSLSPAVNCDVVMPTNVKVKVGVMLDAGSVITLVTNRLVKMANLQKVSDEPYSLRMETVGGDTREVKAFAYSIPILRKNAQVVHVTGFSVETIGSNFRNVNVSSALAALGLTPNSVEYPSGLPLDILIGTDNAKLHPTPVQSPVSNPGLVFANSPLGPVLYGTHPSFSPSQAGQFYHVTIYGVKSCSISDMVATEEMGVACNPKCGSCRCGKCALGSSNLSIKEEREYQNIRDNMYLDNGVVTSDYPWIKNPSLVPSHYGYCLKRLQQFENRLLQREDPSLLEMFREQFQKNVDMGVYRLLTAEEDEEWRKCDSNPIHYLPYREVLKPSSQTTPLRIVLDPASAPDRVCINDFWTSGPKLVINPLGLLIRHREERFAISNDINKMYNQVRTTPRVYHCHRILYRDFDQSVQPDTYVVVRNSFGSRPAGTVAIAALHTVADAGREYWPLGADMIYNQTYVDDIIGSVANAETATRTMKETEECLKLGSFSLKAWTVVDGYNPVQTNEFQQSQPVGGSSDSVLGVRWDHLSDSYNFALRLNLSKKRRNLRTGPDLLPDEILDLQEPLTLRTILSQVNGFYDPLGLIGPYVAELKYSTGQLWKVMQQIEPHHKRVWDTPVPEDFDRDFRILLNCAFRFQHVSFPRVLRPQTATGDPWLVIMTDSSTRIFGACAYVRWTLDDGSFWCRLITAKSRVWPTDPSDFISLCRGELQGAVLGKRLAVSIINESRLNFERVIFLLDSEIVRAQINNDSHLQDIFVGNRVGEILSKFQPDQFYHLKGSDNTSADLLSRGTRDPAKLGTDSDWQKGPPMLYKDFSEWDVSQEHRTTNTGPIHSVQHERDQSYQSVRKRTPDPQVDKDWNGMLVSYRIDALNIPQPHHVVTKFPADMEDRIAARIDASRFSTVSKLLGVTYRFLHALSWKRGCGHFATWMSSLQVVDAEQLQSAQEFWIRQAQRKLLPELHKYKSLKPHMDEVTGIVQLNGRFGEHQEGYHPIFLPSDHPFVVLLVVSIHTRGHNGVTGTAARVRNSYHVLGLKRLAKRIRMGCVVCRKITKKLVEVHMAPLPVERFRPAYAFELCSCDLFGPYGLLVPGRVTRGRPMEYAEGNVLVITCLSTRAIHLECMEGKTTSSFLMSLRRFMSIRGQPRSIWSDNGSQIVAADQELQQIVSSWDDKAIREFGAQHGIKFQYCAPHAPWQNGVSEALINSVKKSLAYLIARKPRMPVMQLQTVFYEIAAMLNERPINLSHAEVPDDWDADTNTYVCPNQLLLGRSTVRIPSGPFGVSQNKHSELFHKVEETVNQWWTHWQTHYLPTLMRQSKWHTSQREVAIGDIVFVKDNGAIRADYKLAEIHRLLPSDKDGRCRNVEVRYKCLPHEPLDISKYSGLPSKYEIRDVKSLVILLTAQERATHE